MSSSLLAIIPARGGSKGLPRKNILPVGGKPLIAWTITAALEASSIDEVILSSDDDETIKMAGEFNQLATACEASDASYSNYYLSLAA